MKPVRWAEAVHMWGLVVLAVLIFMIMAGLPTGFEILWRC